MAVFRSAELPVAEGDAAPDPVTDGDVEVGAVTPEVTGVATALLVAFVHETLFGMVVLSDRVKSAHYQFTSRRAGFS